MFNKIKILFLSLSFVAIISNFSEASVLVNFSGHGLVRSEHLGMNTVDATINPKVYISLVVQNNSTESSTSVSINSPTLTIMNINSPSGCSTTTFTGSSRFQAGWLTGGTLQTANVPLTSASTGLPIILTAQEQVNGVWTEGISISGAGANTLYHIYIAGSIQWTCSRCAPGSIVMSGTLSYSSNATQTAGARSFTATNSPTGTTTEKQFTFPITFSTTKY